MEHDNHDNFAESVAMFRPTVYRVAKNYLRNTHDADDITQNVFLKLYNRKDGFASSEIEKAWLIRVTVNECKNLLKSAWKRNRAELDENIPAPQTHNNDLREYVDSLKPKYRVIIYLYYYERYSTNEIADILKIRQTAVTTQLNRARNQLKDMLEKEESHYGKQLQGNI